MRHRPASFRQLHTFPSTDRHPWSPTSCCASSNILIRPSATNPSRFRRVDSELQKIVSEMFDLMYEQKGIGLAANQVDLPYRLFLINLEGDPEKAEEHVFLNPVIEKRSGAAEAEEGCLSFPEIYAPVKRPEKVTISAYNLSGQEIRMELNGLFARAVQHEYDHLDGVLFIDRLSPSGYAFGQTGAFRSGTGI